MSAHIAQHDVTVHQGDALDVLRTLPDQSVQCIVTSPPYYGLRDYGVAGQLGLESSPAEYVAAMVGVFREARRVLADDGVLWLNIGDSYSSATKGSGGTGKSGLMRDGRKEDQRIVTADRSNGAARFGARPFVTDVPEKNLMGIPWRVAFGLQDDGWTLRNAIIWAKPNAMPESVTDRLSGRYEHVFLFSKSRRYWFDLDAIREPHSAKSVYQQEVARRRPHAVGKAGTAVVPGTSAQSGMAAGSRELNTTGANPGDVWTIATSPFPGAHFATMPPELARRCIVAGCPERGTVLDPFTGSGTTAMVARSLGRRFVGAELNPDYFPIIEKRIGQEPFEFEVTA